jgi:hypothetical protein
MFVSLQNNSASMAWRENEAAEAGDEGGVPDGGGD